MLVALSIGNNVLIVNDVRETLAQTNENENRNKIAITEASKEEADQLFNGLSAGLQIEMPMSCSP